MPTNKDEQPKSTKSIKKVACPKFKFGQKKPTPPDGDPLRRFYTSLLKQNKTSTMALKWCLEHGLLTPKKAEAAVVTLGIKALKL